MFMYYYTVRYFVRYYAVVRQISMLFIDNKYSVLGCFTHVMCISVHNSININYYYYYCIIITINNIIVTLSNTDVGKTTDCVVVTGLSLFTDCVTKLTFVAHVGFIC